MKRKATQVVLAMTMCLAAIAPVIRTSVCFGQSSGTFSSPTPEKFSFDVASIRQNKSGSPPDGECNVPLGPGNVYSPTGGLVSVKNYTLLSYISFAYRMTDGQLKAFRAMAPDWVTDDRFDVQARTERSDVTKDQLRSMMRSLLAERFGLAVHYRTEQVPVYALLLVKAGIIGPKLVSHPVASVCPTTLPARGGASDPPPPETVAGGFPATCGGIVLLPASAPHRDNIGGRGVGMSLLANSLSGWGSLGRPVVDKTGLSGTFDFTLEFVPESASGSAAEDEGNFAGPTFQQALKQQLGLRLETEKADVDVLVLDQIGHLVEN